MWLIFAIAAALTWGLDYSLCERIFGYKISPVLLLFFQMLAGTLVFLPFILRAPLRAQISTIFANHQLLVLTVASITTAVLGGLFISFSIQSKNATLTSLIEICYPLFTIFFTWLIFHENHVTPSVMIGGLFIIVGVVIISL